MDNNGNLNLIPNRQSVADAPLARPTTKIQSFKRWLLHKARSIAFSIAPLRRAMERKRMTPTENMAHWDSLMSQVQFSTYLGGTINVDGANAMTALMLKFHAIAQPSILDVGCSGGTLICALNSFARYSGVDVSSVAISAAKQMASDGFSDRLDQIDFQAADLQQFNPSSTFDVIIFNEVLYYLNTNQAVTEVARYAKSLNKGGLIVISLKDDGKSHAILKLLTRKFKWVDGILWQRKATSYDFAVRPNRERPAFLVGALRLAD